MNTVNLLSYRTRQIASIAIPTLVSCRRNYPPVEGAHIALRKNRYTVTPLY